MSITSSTGSGVRAAARRTLAGLPTLGPGLLFLTAFMAAPVALLAVATFLKRGRFGGLVYEFTLDNWAKLFQPLYGAVLLDSVWIALVVTLLALAIGYPMAYAITLLSPRWRTVALVAVVLPFWTNFLVRVYAWILLLNNAGWLAQGLTALGLLDGQLGILYTQPAVVIGLLYMYLPLMILPLYVSILNVDRQLQEAANDLGSARSRVFFTVTLPLSLPGALTGAVFVFVPAMSNFVIPELIGGGKFITMGNLVRDQFFEARDWPFGAVLALVLTFILLVVILAQTRLSARVSGGNRG